VKNEPIRDEDDKGIEIWESTGFDKIGLRAHRGAVGRGDRPMDAHKVRDGTYHCDARWARADTRKQSRSKLTSGP